MKMYSIVKQSIVVSLVMTAILFTEQGVQATELIGLDAVELVRHCDESSEAAKSKWDGQFLDVTGIIAKSGISRRPFFVFENSGGKCQIICEFWTTFPDKAWAEQTAGLDKFVEGLKLGSTRTVRGLLKIDGTTMRVEDCQSVPPAGAPW